MVACNPRDREAVHRAEVEGIATKNPEAVACKKCRAVIRRAKKWDFRKILAKVPSRQPLSGDEA